MGKLDGKTAIITGASSGFGYAATKLFAQEGCNVVATARRVERLEQLKAECEGLPGKVAIFAGDACEEQTAIDCVQLCMDTFGRIDILINNAGIGYYANLLDEKATIAQYEKIYDTNVKSAFAFTKYAVAHMKEQHSGQLIFVSSAAGVYGYPHESFYSSSKFALRGLAQSMDAEFRADGIKSCAYCPGAGITEFAIGNGRTVEQMENSGMLTSEQVAEHFLFICSQPASVRIIELRTRAMNEPLTPGDAGFHTED